MGAGQSGLVGAAGTCSVSGWDWPLWGTQQGREGAGAFPPLFCESLCTSEGGAALLSLSHSTVMEHCCVCAPVLPVFNTHN